jgi:hypothetical protein
MTLSQIASLGKELAKFLALFVGCFRSRPGFALLQVYIQGLLSNVQRKSIEAIALEFGKAPRTLQRFVESIKWDETGVRDKCQQIVAHEHAHGEAIGCLDESGTAKSGVHTVGAARQWLGSRGKVDNGVVGVHLSYCAPGFQCLLDSELYLTQEWADDPERRKKTTFPTRSSFAPSRRSPWSWSIARWATACVSRPGHSTKATDAIRAFWTASNSVGRSSWRKCRPTSTAGCSNRGCSALARRGVAAVRKSIRGWRGADRRAKCRTCCVIRPPSARSAGSVIASRTRSVGRKSGK